MRLLDLSYAQQIHRPRLLEAWQIDASIDITQRLWIPPVSSLAEFYTISKNYQGHWVCLEVFGE